MKKVICLIVAILMLLGLCACEDETFDVDGAKDVIGKYSEQIEESKEKIEEGIGKFQDILDEVTTEENVD